MDLLVLYLQADTIIYNSIVMFVICGRMGAWGRLGNCMGVVFHYRKFVNIRRNEPTPASPPKPTVSPSQIAKMRPQKQDNKYHIPQPLQLPKHTPHQAQSTQWPKLTKQFHQISRQIKSATNPSTLFHILARNRHRMRLEQILDVLDKVVYYQGTSHNYRHEESDQLLRDRYVGISQAIGEAIFRKIYAPETYIRYVYICSKIKSEQLLNLCLPIAIRILQKQLTLPQPNPKPSSSPSPSLKEPQTPSPEPPTTVNQLISIESTLRLVQSVLRLINRVPNLKQDEQKLLHTYFKNCTSYMHLPSTPARIDNKTLWDLISQYVSVYPRLKLSNSMVKALVKDGIKRIKYEGLLDKVREQTRPKLKAKSGKKGKENEQTKEKQATEVSQQSMQPKKQQVMEIFIINSLKHLFLLQRLLLQQTRPSSLKKQLLQTKPNNLPYNPFHSTQHKINKYLIQLLPKCNFAVTNNDSDNNQELPLWQHIELVPMLTQHLEHLFLGMGVEVVGKCELFSGSYEQYGVVITYLAKLYAYVNRNRPTLQKNHRHNTNRLLGNSYKLLHLMLSPALRNQIPKPLQQKHLHTQLISNLIKYFAHLTPQLKIITLWYILVHGNGNENGYDSGKCKELVGQFLGAWDKKGGNELMWYFRLLVFQGNFRQLLGDELRDKEGDFGFACFKYFIKNIQEYQEKAEGKSDMQLGQAIGNYLRQQPNSPALFQNIIKYYQKISVQNCLFTQAEVQTLSKHKKLFQSKSQDQKSSISKNAYKLKQDIVQRLTLCLRRAQILINAAKGNENEEGNLKGLVRIYGQEVKLLNYGGLVRKGQLEVMERLRPVIEKYGEVKRQEVKIEH